MLVQIPSTADAVGDNGHIYKVFNVYIGGHYHCSLRYSHLLSLSQEVSSLLLTVTQLSLSLSQIGRAHV